MVEMITLRCTVPGVVHCSRHSINGLLPVFQSREAAPRFGDLATSLSRTTLLAHKPRLGATVEPLRDLRDQLQAIFGWALDSLVQGDEADARHEAARDSKRSARALHTSPGR